MVAVIVSDGEEKHKGNRYDERMWKRAKRAVRCVTAEIARLRQLEVVGQLEFLDDVTPQNVHQGENPATPGRALRGHSDGRRQRVRERVPSCV